MRRRNPKFHRLARHVGERDVVRRLLGPVSGIELRNVPVVAIHATFPVHIVIEDVPPDLIPRDTLDWISPLTLFVISLQHLWLTVGGVDFDASNMHRAIRTHHEVVGSRGEDNLGETVCRLVVVESEQKDCDDEQQDHHLPMLCLHVVGLDEPVDAMTTGLLLVFTALVRPCLISFKSFTS